MELPILLRQMLQRPGAGDMPVDHLLKEKMEILSKVVEF